LFFYSSDYVSSKTESTEYDTEAIWTELELSTATATAVVETNNNSDNISSGAFQLSWDRVAIIAGSGGAVLIFITVAYAIFQRRQERKKYEAWGQAATATTAFTNEQQLSTAQLSNVRHFPSIHAPFQTSPHTAMATMPGQFPMANEQRFSTMPGNSNVAQYTYAQQPFATQMTAIPQQYQQFFTQPGPSFAQRSAVSQPMLSTGMPMTQTATSVPQPLPEQAPGNSATNYTSTGLYKGQQTGHGQSGLYQRGGSSNFQ